LIWFLVGGVSFLLLQNIRDLSYSSLFYPFVVIFVFISFAWVVWKKTWNYFKNIRNFILSSGIVYAFTILAVAYFAFSDYQPFLGFQDHLPLFGINFIFTLIYVIFLFRFTFASTYTATPISILFEKSRQVFHQVEKANAKGSIQLKKSLIQYYEMSSIKDMVDSFDFHLLIDETIDNAIEHGGKRSYDDINVYIIETTKFIEIYVIDRGKGFDPKRLPSPLREDRKLVPSGRGIHLLKELFEVRWNFLGNEVCVRIRKSTI
jgi:anti-sigma regulatory factor (Ser/Thr protein kinase)